MRIGCEGSSQQSSLEAQEIVGQLRAQVGAGRRGTCFVRRRADRPAACAQGLLQLGDRRVFGNMWPSRLHGTRVILSRTLASRDCYSVSASGRQGRRRCS